MLPFPITLVRPVTLSTGARRQIDSLLASQPETAPWLGVLSAVLEEAADGTPGASWDTIAASAALQAEHAPGTPLLAGARIPIDARLADRWVRRVLALAAEAGPEAVGLRAAADDDPSGAPLDARAFLEAAVTAEARKSTRLNSSHLVNSYAVFCLKTNLFF